MLWRLGLILQGDVGGILIATSSTLLGMFIIGSAFERYMVGIGRLWPAREDSRSICGYSVQSYPLRGVFIASGTLLGLPCLQGKGLWLAIAAVILVLGHHRGMEIKGGLN